MLGRFRKKGAHFLFTISPFGVVPISQTISGAALRIGAVPLFVVVGGLVVATALVSTTNRRIRAREFRQRSLRKEVSR